VRRPGGGHRHAPPPAWATDITYALSSAFLENPSAATLSGTITTDGVIGNVQTSDIVAYDITAVFDSNTIEETTANSHVVVVHGGLTATAKNLNFDFTHVPNAVTPYVLEFRNKTDGSGICFDDNAKRRATCGQASAVGLRNIEGTQLDDFPAASDTIASSAPEPAAWTMMLIGAAGVGGLLRRRRAALLAA
jgi:hypothetical protein